MEQAQPQSVLGGASAAPAGAPKKKSNAGIIIAIIVAALVITGGAIAAVLIITNSNKDKEETSTSQKADDKKEDKKLDKDDDEDEDEDEDDDDEDTVDDIDDEDEDEDEDTGKVATDKPYTKNSAYFISINGKKYDFNNTITEVEKSGFKMHAQAKDQQVPAGGYLILIGGSRLTDSDSDGFSYTPYNDGKEKIPVSKAKLGSVTIRTPYSDSAKAKFNKITVYGGIHVGSTLAQLKAAFGEPTNKTEASYGDTYEYKDSTYRKYSFSVKNGVVDEITWTNYGSLVR